jgi:hypothetical protein
LQLINTSYHIRYTGEKLAQNVMLGIIVEESQLQQNSGVLM